MSAYTYTHNGKPLPQEAYTASNGFFSLSTSKMIKGVNRSGSMGIDIGRKTGRGTGPFVYGTTEQVQDFMTQNLLTTVSVSPMPSTLPGIPAIGVPSTLLTRTPQPSVLPDIPTVGAPTFPIRTPQPFPLSTAVLPSVLPPAQLPATLPTALQPPAVTLPTSVSLMPTSIPIQQAPSTGLPPPLLRKQGDLSKDADLPQVPTSPKREEKHGFFSGLSNLGDKIEHAFSKLLHPSVEHTESPGTIPNVKAPVGRPIGLPPPSTTLGLPVASVPVTSGLPISIPTIQSIPGIPGIPGMTRSIGMDGQKRSKKSSQTQGDISAQGGPRFMFASEPDAVCEYGSAGSIFVLTPDIRDVEQLPDHVIASMCPFHLGGLRGKGKVSSVTDGDTVSIVIYVPMQDLSKKILAKKGRGSNTHYEPQYQAISGHKESTGFFTVITVRLLGVDTAEKNTIQGQVAKRIMIDKYRSLNNIVYYDLSFERDKYGRLLATLYEDPAYKVSLNEYILNAKSDPSLGPIAFAYDGGTKSDYMKQLPTSNAHGKGAPLPGTASSPPPMAIPQNLGLLGATGLPVASKVSGVAVVGMPPVLPAVVPPPGMRSVPPSAPNITVVTPARGIGLPTAVPKFAGIPPVTTLYAAPQGFHIPMETIDGTDSEGEDDYDPNYLDD